MSRLLNVKQLKKNQLCIEADFVYAETESRVIGLRETKIYRNTGKHKCSIVSE